MKKVLIISISLLMLLLILYIRSLTTKLVSQENLAVGAILEQLPDEKDIKDRPTLRKKSGPSESTKTVVEPNTESKSNNSQQNNSRDSQFSKQLKEHFGTRQGFIRAFAEQFDELHELGPDFTKEFIDALENGDLEEFYDKHKLYFNAYDHPNYDQKANNAYDGMLNVPFHGNDPVIETLEALLPRNVESWKECVEIKGADLAKDQDSKECAIETLEQFTEAYLLETDNRIDRHVFRKNSMRAYFRATSKHCNIEREDLYILVISECVMEAEQMIE